MVTKFAEALAGVQADPVCGAGYGERSDDRRNTRTVSRWHLAPPRAGDGRIEAGPCLIPAAVLLDGECALRRERQGPGVHGAGECDERGADGDDQGGDGHGVTPASWSRPGPAGTRERAAQRFKSCPGSG